MHSLRKCASRPYIPGMSDLPAMLQACNCFAVRQAARRISGLYDGHLAKVGLRATQYAVLSRLAQDEPLAINALADAMGADRTTMGRAVRPLEREGLVVIGPGRDGRTRALSLTEAGRARLVEARPHWRRAQAAFEDAYGAEEAAALRTALSRVPEA